ncbi:MAG: HAD family hydrolase [Microthrixaceae bacterium]
MPNRSIHPTSWDDASPHGPAGSGEPIDLVIFDCDGVLVDSERLAVRVESELLTSLGWELTEADVLERFVGRSDAYMHEQIELNLGRPVPEWDAMYRSSLHEAFLAELVAVEGIEAALDELTIPTCVASSGTHEKLRMTLGLTGLFDRFESRIYSTTEVANGKPAPDLFLHAAAQHNAAPPNCLVIEDSRSGVEAARAAGMRSLGYAGGLTPRSWLEGPSTVVFDDMANLVKLIDSLQG